MQGRAIVLMSAPFRAGDISMNEEQLQKIGQSLQEILAELRTINGREERRDEKSSAVQDRFANL
jgi:septation ring formation regulator EzrA